MNPVSFHPATAAAVEAYYGAPSPHSFRGYVAMQDGEPIGIGGVYFVGSQPWAFSECKVEMTLGNKARAIRILRGVIEAFKIPVFATAQLPTSMTLLPKLGFRETGQSVEQGPIMVRMP